MNRDLAVRRMPQPWCTGWLTRAPALAAWACATAWALAPAWADPLVPEVAPPQPRFSQLYPNERVIEFLYGYARAYPDWVSVESLGATSAGGETLLVTINNPATGEHEDKPGFYTDGAIHANEAQATETVLYMIDFMLRHYGRLEPLTQTMDRAAFYFVPIVNPAGRALWFEQPATPNYPRTALVPVDDDRDGAVDEDPFEDLNGDGEITQMRKRVPMGEGTHVQHPDDARLLRRVTGTEQGNYIELGTEGVDNDGDGRLNEDPPGYVDPNRTWGYDWQPPYVQRGAGRYPLAIPETRNIAQWALGRPNIAGVQSFHNTGRMILRGPGAKSSEPYPREDIAVYDVIAGQGTAMLPGYRYFVIFEDLYTVYGGTTEHFYGIHGVISFTNELHGPEQDFDGDGEVTEAERLRFSDLLTLGRMFVEWEAFEHPQYGTIEVGGYRHDTGRVPESFMLAEDSHRNALFALLHASHMPRLSLGEPRVEPLGAGDSGAPVSKVTIAVRNDRAIPTVAARAREHRLHRFDIAEVSGVRVIASGVAETRFGTDVARQAHRPERLMVDGVPGFGARHLVFWLAGTEPATLSYHSLKGGRVTAVIDLADAVSPESVRTGAIDPKRVIRPGG